MVPANSVETGTSAVAYTHQGTKDTANNIQSTNRINKEKIWGRWKRREQPPAGGKEAENTTREYRESTTRGT